jgi:hypothetical protein
VRRLSISGACHGVDSRGDKVSDFVRPERYSRCARPAAGVHRGMAVSRFETRKELAVEESTAIGTSYLRAQLVPSPEGPEISSRLRDYVDVRLEFSRARTDLDRQTARARAARVEDEVWSRAESSISTELIMGGGPAASVRTARRSC